MTTAEILARHGLVQADVVVATIPPTHSEDVKYALCEAKYLNWFTYTDLATWNIIGYYSERDVYLVKRRL